ncbi:hypothetical protein BCR39DRAFT_524423 [Naematelia encephala]|uniref:Uncharacterized protein n=1 Tax=Naematelia encephala TaxID=71784 RepID=A0A1Y2BBG8_9TREE|nr:hypothetical protein BCR39DRAFT_524423 [Naematelia encephala]
MSPSGLVISKLAIQATASEESVKGILCLKISLPSVTDSRQPLRWPLFTSKPPKLLSTPIIQPLPLPDKYRKSHNKRLRIAATLLSLPQPNAYPPSQLQGLSKPSIDVSSTTGQIYVVLNSSGTPSRRQEQNRDDSAARREYLVVLDVEVPLEDLSRVSIPLPKCLDNVIRFQIVAPESQGEVSILTEPKLLPLPASAFSIPAWPAGIVDSQRVVGKEDGWEDGEDLVPGEFEVEDEQDSSADEASWLEGRFQSTDALHLEWSFASTSSVAKLRVDPHYDSMNPSIHLFFEGSTDISESSANLEAILPEGWGWKTLSISSPSLVHWLCADASWGMPDMSVDDYEIEDSFSTVRSSSKLRPPAMPRLSPHAPSLLRTTMPDMSLDEFSFEMNSFDTSRPRTPIGRRAETPPTTGLNLEPPQAGSSFDLRFRETGRHVIVLEATIVPLDPLLLVSPSVPVKIPIIRLDSSELSVDCPAASLGTKALSASDIVNSETGDIGAFIWTNGGRPIPQPSGTMQGDVLVRIQQKRWWTQSLSISFKWPKEAREICFTLPVPRDSIRVDRANISGIAMPRALTETEGECEVRFGRTSNSLLGSVEIILEVEMGNEGEVAVPWLKDGNGKITVKLTGDNWRGLSKAKTSLDRFAGNIFISRIPSAKPYLRLTDRARSGTSSRWSGLASGSTLVHLFTLWLLVSLAQQVQRLRTEVAFIAEEAHDLRLYGFQQTAVLPTESPLSGVQSDTTQVPANAVVERTEYPLGRVVFGDARWGWHDLARHPTLVTLGRSLEWVWRALEWLIHS